MMKGSATQHHIHIFLFVGDELDNLTFWSHFGVKSRGRLHKQSLRLVLALDWC